MTDLSLDPVITVTGLIERVLLHEARTPNFPGYDAALAFRTMRLSNLD